MIQTTNQIEALAPAKVNLFLEVEGKREDGFHGLSTVMTTIDLYDRLRFVARSDDQINLAIVSQATPGQASPDIPTDDRNLIVQALKMLRSHFHPDPQLASPPWGCDVYLAKGIPSEAGLGGASSDAATALMAGCRLWGLPRRRAPLEVLAARIGSDVPFFLTGGTALCQGRGELIRPIVAPAGMPVVVAKPSVGLATGRVFGQCQVPGRGRSFSPLLKSVVAGDRFQVGKMLFNRLQDVAISLAEPIAEMVRLFGQTGALGCQMSGSGTSVFGVFSTCRQARQAARCLSARVPDTKITFNQTLGPVPFFGKTGC